MLDKNPKLDFDKNFLDFMKILESNTLNHVMYSDPFLKLDFLNRIILATNFPIIYLDLDLLFSGYIASNIIHKNENVTLYQPNKHNFLETIKKILLEISEKKSILIVDSLNGMFNFYHDNKDAGRLINSFIMLFGSVAKNSESKIIVSSMARRKNNEEWILSITGRHIVESKQMNLIQLEKKNSSIITNILDEKAVPKKSFSFQFNTEII